MNSTPRRFVADAKESFRLSHVRHRFSSAWQAYFDPTCPFATCIVMLATAGIAPVCDGCEEHHQFRVLARFDFKGYSTKQELMMLPDTTPLDARSPTFSTSRTPGIQKPSFARQQALAVSELIPSKALAAEDDSQPSDRGFDDYWVGPF